MIGKEKSYYLTVLYAKRGSGFAKNNKKGPELPGPTVLVVPDYGVNTTFMQPSFLSRKVL
jgi:hypothetical protein